MSSMILWIKAVHIIAVISWMAGLLYLPRLFVYHADVAPNSPQSETFKVMEHRLLRYIMNPAMITVWVTGLYLAWLEGVTRDGWLMAKLALVVVLTTVHMLFARWRRAFVEGRNVHDARFYRFVNEVPTGLMIAIVILVVLKPF